MLDKTRDSLETLLASRRKTLVDMLTSAVGGHDTEEPGGTTTDVYKHLSDLYMQTCSVKVDFVFPTVTPFILQFVKF